jgi:hypothetical protein
MKGIGMPASAPGIIHQSRSRPNFAVGLRSDITKSITF